MSDDPPTPPTPTLPSTPTPAAPVAHSNIVDRELKNELSKSYIDYAMSVIVARAIPDVRDGMKPVQRRILYSMGVNNFYSNRPHRKCATIVGHVLGHYHPHGDASVYAALVRIAQDFSVRYTLIDGQGNFGSVDGDNAAAYRYTEARLDRISNELLGDIDKNTVDFVDTYDGSEKEPAYLPAKLPAMLLNGATGIAVGMSTNMAPHNLTEVCAAICAAIDMGPVNLTPADVGKYVLSPDFPTGGSIMGKQGFLSALHTGRSNIVIRSKTEIVPEGAGKKKDAIIVTEIPYMVNKARLIESIAGLVNKGVITEISDVRDESDRTGMRICIELKRNADPNAVLNRLFHRTQLQNSFNIINLALVENGKMPKILNYAQIIQEFIKHRELVVTRRTQFELDKAEKRLHIILGLLIAINNIDEVIKIIKKSPNPADAALNLIAKFSLSDIQAAEILKMPLGRLTNLQTKKLVDEEDELNEKIAEFKDIIGNRDRRLAIIKLETEYLSDKFGDPRRSQIVELEEPLTFDFAETVPEEECVIIITKNQQIKRMTLETYQAQGRGGKGKRGMKMREEDLIQEMFTASSHDTILLFTQQGRVYSIPAYKIHLASRNAKGKAIVNYIKLRPGEVIIDITNISDFTKDEFLIFASAKGLVKKTILKAFSNIRSTGIHCMKVRDGDQLVRVKLLRHGDQILVPTKKGYLVRFEEKELRAIGRTAMGVKGVTLRNESDAVVDLIIADPKTDPKVMTITKGGYGKLSKMSLYRLTHRGGKGVINIKLRRTTDEVISVKSVPTEMNLLLASSTGNLIRIRTQDIRQTGRAAMGVILMRMGEDDAITSVALCDTEEEASAIPIVKPEDDPEAATDSEDAEKGAEILSEVPKDTATEPSSEEKQEKSE